MGMFDNPIVVGAAAAGLGFATSGGSYVVAGLMGLSAYSSMAAGEARADSLEAQMRLGLLASQETLARGMFNASLTLQQGKQIVGQQRAGYAGMGVSTLAGSPLEQSQESLRNAYNESLRIKREAEFDAGMQRMGALGYGDAASRERTSSLLGAVSDTAMGAYKFYKPTQDTGYNADKSLLGKGV